MTLLLSLLLHKVFSVIFLARVGFLTNCLISFEKSACRDLALNAAAQVNSYK